MLLVTASLGDAGQAGRAGQAPEPDSERRSWERRAEEGRAGQRTQGRPGGRPGSCGAFPTKFYSGQRPRRHLYEGESDNAPSPSRNPSLARGSAAGHSAASTWAVHVGKLTTWEVSRLLITFSYREEAPIPDHLRGCSAPNLEKHKAVPFYFISHGGRWELGGL